MPTTPPPYICQGCITTTAHPGSCLAYTQNDQGPTLQPKNHTTGLETQPTSVNTPNLHKLLVGQVSHAHDSSLHARYQLSRMTVTVTLSFSREQTPTTTQQHSLSSCDTPHAKYGYARSAPGTTTFTCTDNKTVLCGTACHIQSTALNLPKAVIEPTKNRVG